ncbi:unnamed protein product [Bemisia tabaci]|uniref:Uncharacterized protein n=1 Tax=Bemisia tabaci TaxID=7038 RepID=A0A9P0CCR3_BEMTA|nr:unnamed protein product [Bemisia tabaci]
MNTHTPVGCMLMKREQAPTLDDHPTILNAREFGTLGVTIFTRGSSSGPKGVSTATVGGSGPADLGGPQTAPTRATPWSANGRVGTTCRKVRRAFRGMALPPAYLHFQAEVASPRKRSSVGGMPYHGVLKGPSGGSSPRTSDRPRGRTFTGSGGG